MTKPVYLILSQSGRMLAKAASEGGFSCVVIDQFGDMDTQGYALAVKVLPEFSDDDILSLVEQVWEEYSFHSIVLGSGLEGRLDLMQHLADSWPLAANSVEAVRKTKDPMILSEILRDLDIAHPRTQKTPPEDLDQNLPWLVKEQGGSGGDHVTWYSPEKTYPSSHYFQEFLPGKNYSVVFLADGKRIEVLGYNQALPVQARSVSQSGHIGHYSNDKPFIFSGAISLSEFPHNEVVKQMLEQLVSVVKLVGLCGADFIVDEQNNIHLLEINPRPTATFDLHDNSQKSGDSSFFMEHLDACQGHLPARGNNLARGLVLAKEIVYANTELRISKIDWPLWASDIPSPGSLIKKGQPICTVYCHSDDANKVEKILKNQCDMIESLLIESRV